MGHARLAWTAAMVAGATVAGTSAGHADISTISSFSIGDLVVSVEGNGPQTPGVTYGDNQAAPLTLYEYSLNGTKPATLVGGLVLPQAANSAGTSAETARGNWDVSGEYGSSSEGTLELTGNGDALVIMGYGVNATYYNKNYSKLGPNGGNAALAQSGSLTGQSYTPVPRVAAVISQSGSVNSTTALYNVFDQNNPRSVASVNGTSFYVSGQGAYPDATGGVFYTTLGSHSATSVTGADAGPGVSQDTRTVEIHDNTLYVSTDSKKGATNRSFIGTLGTSGALPTTVANGGAGPAQLNGFGSGSTGKVTITSGPTSNGNGLNAGKQVNLSPSNFFFANADTLYVADTGSPKQTSASSAIGDGGLQKWSLVNGTWTLDYTLSAGLDLVENSTADPANTAGTTGLYGLTGEDVTVNGVHEVELFATNYTIGDLDPTYLFGITDVLSDTKNPGDESFVTLATAPADTNFKGVSFAPVPEPSTWAMLLAGFAGLGFAGFRRARAARPA